MRKTFIPFAVATLLAGTAVQTQAESRIDHRQANQRDRIQQGVASGDLTRREAARLIGQQRDIRRTERRFAADGFVGPRERAMLHHQLDHASRNIYRQRHDAQRVHGRGGHYSRHWGHARPYISPYGLPRHYGHRFGHRPGPRHFGHYGYGRHHRFHHRPAPRHFGHYGHGRHFGHRPAPRHYGGGHAGARRGWR